MSFRIQIIPVLLIALALNGIYVFNYFNTLLDAKYMMPKRILHSEIEDFLLQRDESEKYDRTLPRKRIYKIGDEDSEEMPELIKERGKRSQSAALAKSEMLLEQLEEAAAIAEGRPIEEAKIKKAKTKVAKDAETEVGGVEKVEEVETKKVKKEKKPTTEETVEAKTENISLKSEETEVTEKVKEKKAKKVVEETSSTNIQPEPQPERVLLDSTEAPTKTKKKPTAQKVDEVVIAQPKTPIVETVEVEKVKEKKIKKEEVVNAEVKTIKEEVIVQPETPTTVEKVETEKVKDKKVKKEKEEVLIPEKTTILPEPENVVVEEVIKPGKKKQEVSKIDSSSAPVVEVLVKEKVSEKDLQEVIIPVTNVKPGIEACPTGGVECSELLEVRVPDWDIGSSNDTKGITKKKKLSLDEKRVPVAEILN